MEFLIIGNGFDIAHGLLTQYPQFLSFCRDYDENGSVSENDALNKEFSSFLETNIWLKYFHKIAKTPQSNETWIDFEKEISEIIKTIEKGAPSIYREHHPGGSGRFAINLNRTQISQHFGRFLSCFCTYNSSQIYTFSVDSITDWDSFLEFIYCQLREFTRAFEIYCLKINETQIEQPVVSMELKEKISDVSRAITECDQKIITAGTRSYRQDDYTKLKKIKEDDEKAYHSLLQGIRVTDYLSMSKFDCVLSFNYTNTYERLYGNEETKYCYIHGKAQKYKNRTNLILGIDDSLPDDRLSKDFRCVRFKKYYQRIIFRTGSEYKDWLVMDSKQLSHRNYVHIVGHSLDRTDYDVLYEFFSDKRFKIIVYYYKPADFEEKVQKVIQLLAYKGGNGRDELIRRVHGKNWSIRFTYLYDENVGLFKAPPEIKELEPLNQ